MPLMVAVDASMKGAAAALEAGDTSTAAESLGDQVITQLCCPSKRFTYGGASWSWPHIGLQRDFLNNQEVDNPLALR